MAERCPIYLQTSAWRRFFKDRRFDHRAQRNPRPLVRCSIEWPQPPEIHILGQLPSFARIFVPPFRNPADFETCHKANSP